MLFKPTTKIGEEYLRGHPVKEQKETGTGIPTGTMIYWPVTGGVYNPMDTLQDTRPRF